MVKAIKVMLIPNNVQKTKMFQYAGASRFAYNWALAREIENYEKGEKFLSDAELRKEFTKLRHSDEYAWLSTPTPANRTPTPSSRTTLRRSWAE